MPDLHGERQPQPATVRNRVRLPIRLGSGATVTAFVHSFNGLIDGGEHLAIALGPSSVGTPLVRPHSECLTGDVLGSERCDCGPQLAEAIERISTVGGYLLYLRQEGRGIGLYAKLDAYALQEGGLDTYQANVALGYPADARDYTVAAQMLTALGVSRVNLLTNNPDKARALNRLGITVAAMVSTETHISPANVRYLSTKAFRSGHRLRLTAPKSPPGNPTQEVVP